MLLPRIMPSLLRIRINLLSNGITKTLPVKLAAFVILLAADTWLPQMSK